MALRVPDDLFLLDQLGADAWPPALTEQLGSWRLRWAWGLTRRANSALALGSPDRPLEAAVQRVEAFYARHSAPVRFQLGSGSAPTGLRSLLERRGYQRDAPTSLMVARAAEVARPAVDGWQVTLSPTLTDDWFATYRSSASKHQAGPADPTAAERYRATFLRPDVPTVFAAAFRNDVPAAVGQALAQPPWAGIQCMATLADWRGRGAARAVLGAIAAWAQSQALPNLYLAVMEGNHPARHLYEWAGFREAGWYAYWV